MLKTYMTQYSAVSTSDVSGYFGHEYDIMLLKKMSQKDSLALSEFYDIHSKYLYTIIYNILLDKTEADDILQEVFLFIWNNTEIYDETIGNPLSWIACITRKKAIERLRSKSLINRYMENGLLNYDFFDESRSLDQENNTLLNQLNADIISALNSLDQDHLKLIDFAFFRGFNQSELAEHFDIPLDTVKIRLRSALLSFRKRLNYLK